jgi:hypothetical protein
MIDEQKNSGFHIKLDEGGSLARRKTELLPDGAYLFEDELEVGGVVTASVITCAAWLLELTGSPEHKTLWSSLPAFFHIAALFQ